MTTCLRAVPFIALFALLALSNTRAAKPAPATPSPSWKILVLIYPSTDHKFSDSTGHHHVIARMTEHEIQRAQAQARRFFEHDVPELTAGAQRPVVTIKTVDRPLTDLDKSWWPSPRVTAKDCLPDFDSIVVIWHATGLDAISNKPIDLADAGGLAEPRGVRQTYCAIPINYVSQNDRNVFKHEWGHSILFYFDAAGITPKPAVDNHINDTDIQYVHYPSGEKYILKDETDDHPIPNSIYNNQRGFTRDYYSGQTATADKPNRPLGITPKAWATGGPVTKPPPK